jgi:predicted Fe-S protein YdhL (DUF1289 family)
MGHVTSPCNNICQLNDNKVCIGCFRTINEIANWTKYTDREKKNIIEQIEKRKDEIF